MKDIYNDLNQYIGSDQNIEVLQGDLWVADRFTNWVYVELHTETGFVSQKIFPDDILLIVDPFVIAKDFNPNTFPTKIAAVKILLNGGIFYVSEFNIFRYFSLFSRDKTAAPKSQ